MERVVQGRAFTLSKTFYIDGVAATPTGTPTVTIVRVSDGTTVTAGAVTGTGVGPYQVTVTAAANSVLDSLTVTWTATLSSQVGTYTDTVEVAGDTVFTLADLIAVRPPNQSWTTAQMADMRTTVEDAIELEYGTALVPRYRREKFSGDGSTLLRLTGPVRAIRDIVINGTALDSTALAALYMQDDWLSGYTWGLGVGNIIIGYEYGLDGPPGRVSQAAVRLARQWLVSGPIDDRALGAASPDGNFSFGLATPGRNGSIFGMPELDAIVTSSPYRTGVA